MSRIMQTNRLTIREVVENDFSNLLKMFNDTEVMRFYRDFRDESKTLQ